MKITFGNHRHAYSGFWGFLAQWITMTLSCIVATLILPGVHIDSILTAFLTSAIIALLDTFIRPILIVLTIPFTLISMGLFLLVINAAIILLASALVPQFQVDGFWWALLFSIVLVAIDYLLELPNRSMRRPPYRSSDQGAADSHVDEEDFTEYEEIDPNSENK